MKEQFLKNVQYILNDAERHWFSFAPFFFGFGIIAYFGLEAEPSPYMGPIASFFLGLFVWASLKEQKLIKALLFFYVALIAIGFSAAQYRTFSVQAPVLEKKHGPVFVKGVVESIKDLPSGQRVLIRVDEVEKLKPFETPRKVRLKSYHAFGVNIGDKVKVLSVLKPPSPPVFPGDFDFQRYAYFRQWGAVGYTLRAFEVVKPAKDTGFLNAVRISIETHLEKSLGQDNSAIPKALLIGNRSTINQDDLDAIRDAGLAHMLAISGLHVGLVAGFIFFFLRLFLAAFPYIALNYNIKKIAAGAGLIAAFFYMLIVGAPITTQRAFIMTGLVMVAIILDRYPFSFRLAALAAFTILIYRPESLLEVSFQLSFSAVVALIAFYDFFGKRLWRRFAGKGITFKINFWLLSVTLTTLVASIATAPLTLYHFQHLALYGILGNILGVPVMTFWVMPMGIISTLLMPTDLAGWSLYLMSEGVEFILSISYWIQGFDGAVLHTKTWSVAALSVSILGAVLILFFTRGGWWMGCLLLIFGLFLASKTKLPDLLVSDSAGEIAYFDGRELYISSGRQGSFVKENWQRLYGFEGRPRQNLDTIFDCDEVACRKDIKGIKISYTDNLAALSEECLWADILIADFPVQDRECEARQIIDRFDVWRSGVHAFYFKASGRVDVVTVADKRGKRPWFGAHHR